MRTLPGTSSIVNPLQASWSSSNWSSSVRKNALQHSNLWHQTPLPWQPRAADERGRSVPWVLYGLRRCQLGTKKFFYNPETSPSSFTQTLILSCFSCLQYAYSKYHQLASWNGLGTGLLCYGWLASFPILVPQLLWLAVRSTLLRLQATIAVVCGLGMKPMV